MILIRSQVRDFAETARALSRLELDLNQALSLLATDADMTAAEAAITALQSAVATAQSDILAVEADIVTLEAIVGSYGQIHKAGTITGIGPLSGSYTKLTGFDSNGISGGGVSVDQSNNKITTNAAGKFRIRFDGGLVNADVAGNIAFQIYVSGVASGFLRSIWCPAAAEVMLTSVEALLSLSANDYIEVYVAATSGTPTVELNRPSLIVERIV